MKTGFAVYDPESLLTGKEIAAGLDYSTPRHYPTPEDKALAYSGKLTPEEIAERYPRMKDKSFTVGEDAGAFVQYNDRSNRLAVILNQDAFYKIFGTGDTVDISNVTVSFARRNWE